jgi:PP-loop superfamily ATP-utilizing enzyme
MQTYAEYLATNTVKTLNAIAKKMGLKGYSKLRKAELITFIDNNIKTDTFEAAEIDRKIDCEAEISAIEVESTPNVAVEVTPEDRIREVMTNAAKPAKAVKVATVTAVTETLRSLATDDLIEAYRGYRATVFKLGNVPSRVKIAIKAREIAAILKARKVNMREI